MFINFIAEINPLENTFKIEGFLDLVWCDPKLSFDPKEIGFEEEVFLAEAAVTALNRICWPDISIDKQVGTVE